MTKAYSVAEVRSRLPRLLDDVESGRSVQITRRGKPVAVLVSVPDYRRMSGAAGTFAQAYRAWRSTVDPDDLLPRDYYASLRDRSPGRKVRL